MIRRPNKRQYRLDEPLFHPDHKRPIKRRDFIAQGFQAGMGTVVASSMLGLMGYSGRSHADLSDDVLNLYDNCAPAQGDPKIPFICIDLAGGANISGSNVLVGGQGGQKDFLSTSGYSKLGLPGDMVPGVQEATPTATSNGDHIDETLGLAFHSDSQFLAGILERAGSRVADINGAVIPARSENDTGNNPHNPMYGVARAGAVGEFSTIIGSRSTLSGGNSMAPAMMIDESIPPTKVDRPTDVTGLVEMGDLSSFGLNTDQAVAAMEAMQRISGRKLAVSSTGLSDAVRSQELKDAANCAYAKSTYLADEYGDQIVDPAADPDIVGAAGIFSVDEFTNDREFQKTASVMKMVMEGYAGAGTITMGGYDYHTGNRSTGEARDLRAGRCMGACLEYAARKNKPLMLYVFSDGSVFSNGMIDDSEGGRGKGVWTGDNSSTAASFFLVYNPPVNGGGASIQLLGATPEEQARHQQIGWMRQDASVETAATPAANNVNLLVETVVLNYMALNGDQAQFGNSAYFPNNGLGDASNWDNYIAFASLN